MRSGKVAFAMLFALSVMAILFSLCTAQLELPSEIRLNAGSSVELTVKGLRKAVVEDSRVASLLLLSGERISIQGVSAGETILRLWVGEEKYEVPVKVEAKPVEEERKEAQQKEETKEEALRPPIELPAFPEETREEGDKIKEPAVEDQKESALSIAIVADTPTAVAGAQVWLKVRLKNDGADVRGLVVTVSLPERVELVSDSPKPECDYDPALRKLTWRLKELKGGESCEFAFSVLLSRDLAPKERLGFIATAEYEGALVKLASEPATIEVVSAALSAIFVFPSSFVVKRSIGLPLLDVKYEEYQKVVDRLQGLGVVHGYPEHTFRPNRYVTRAEATKMLVLTTNLTEHMDSVRIGYVLSAEATVNIYVLDSQGKRVAHLLKDKRCKPMQYYVSWDGKADDGAWVEPGEYEIQVVAVSEGGGQITLSANVRALPLPHRKLAGIPTFVDISPKDWFAGYVAEAQARRLVYGYPDGSFKPKHNLTRAEAAAMIVRALGIEERVKEVKDTPTPFEDDEEIPKWARGYIVVATTEAPKASGKPIIGYVERRFKPRHFLSRAEAATIMARFLDRDVERKVVVVGAVAPGVKLNINGKVVGDEKGTFAEELELKPGVNIITVMVQ
ncbi:MAG: hypothetical protein RUDDFDWM_000468 [Candidatus Fervidibacterota bacterium]